MNYLLLTLSVILMSASCHCYSESMSCSTVNGRTVCERRTSNGNTAGAFSGAYSGQDGAYQDAAAMAGNTFTGHSESSRTVVDGNSFRGYGTHNQYPNNNAAWMLGSGHLSGNGASEATSFRSNTGHAGISTSGFAGRSNNFGIPGPAFGGFAVANPNGNNYYGGGNAYGGGYAHGNPNPFDAVNNVMRNANLGFGFPFNVYGKKR